MKSLFVKYIEEREGIEVIETPRGYATYRITGDECYLKDMFVLKEFRQQDLGRGMADEVCEIAKSRGCKYLLVTICPSTNGCMTSLKAVIAYGMILHSSMDNLILFKKEII